MVLWCAGLGRAIALRLGKTLHTKGKEIQDKPSANGTFVTFDSWNFGVQHFGVQKYLDTA